MKKQMVKYIHQDNYNHYRIYKILSYTYFYYLS